MRRRTGATLLAVGLPPLLGVAVVVLAWQLVAVRDPYLLPRPAATLAELADHPRLFLDTARSTLGEAAAGLGIGGAAAVLTAIAMSQVRAVERAVMPLAVVLNVTPVVAVAPALVVAFGFGATPKVVVTALIVFFTMLVTTLSGLRSTDPRVLDVMRTLAASRWESLVRVEVPSAVPSVFTGLRIALPLAVVGAVVAEFAAPGSSAGLGTLIDTASEHDDLQQVYAALLCLAVIGVAVTSALAAVERRLSRWRPSTRAAA